MPAETAPVLDVMLGKLATYLRMGGYDTVYALDRGIEDDDALVRLAREEARVLITRDVELARRTPESILLHTREVDAQLAELLDAGFTLSLTDPTRCSRCNGPLRRIGSEEKTPDFAPAPDERAVWRCVECGQPFWRGSHWQDVETTLESVHERAGETYRYD
ncbi:MAG: Mut7-C RNAse domain-containing protein [Halalkalicoccus sp.]